MTLVYGGVLHLHYKKMPEERKWNTKSTCKLIELIERIYYDGRVKPRDYKNCYKRALENICLSLNINSVYDTKKINKKY